MRSQTYHTVPRWVLESGGLQEAPRGSADAAADTRAYARPGDVPGARSGPRSRAGAATGAGAGGINLLVDLPARREAMERTIQTRLATDTNATVPSGRGTRRFFGGLNSRGAAGRRANDEVRECYEIHANAPTNAAVLAQRGSAGISAPAVGLQRQASFLAIAPQLVSIDATQGHPRDNVGKKLDAASHTVMDNLLRTVQFHGQNLQLKAVEAAHAGERVLPLALQHAAFSEFLDSQTPLLHAIVEACEHAGGAADRLQPLLTEFGASYLDRADLLPVGAQPLTVALSHRAFWPHKSEYIEPTATQNDIARISIQTDMLGPDLDVYESELRGFTQHPEHVQRAAVVTQVMIGALVDLEEHIAAGGWYAQFSEEADRATAGTAAEMDYRGSREVGDLCGNDSGTMQERRAQMWPLLFLRNDAQQYQRRYREPLISDPALQQWMDGPDFANDRRAAFDPAARLRMAQAPSTASLLLDNPAFAH
jgi:hypothetical protein